LVSNSDDTGMNAISRAVSASLYPAKAVAASERVTPSPEQLSQYAGVYRLSKDATLTFVSQGGALYGRLTGQPFLKLTAGAADSFTVPAVAAEFAFKRANSAVASVTLRQGGADQRALRTEQAAPTLALLPRAELAAFEGQFRLAPGADFEVTALAQDGGAQLLVKLAAQPRLPVFPVAGAKDRFAYDVVDAQLQFERDASGVVTALVLHQNGEQRAVRIVK
jgi:serine-type D-Ala-D-Ala carboxypeptidase/endopeptidase